MLLRAAGRVSDQRETKRFFLQEFEFQLQSDKLNRGLLDNWHASHSVFQVAIIVLSWQVQQEDTLHESPSWRLDVSCTPANIDNYLSDGS